MNEPEQIEAPPPLPPASPPPRRPLPLPELLVYIMLPGAAALCLQCSLLDIYVKIFGTAVALGAFWIGFYRLKAPVVLLILLGCILTSHVNFPPLSVTLMTASALAGGVGAWLTHSEAEEDDFFFLPLLTLVGIMVLMIALGAGGGWPKMAERIGRSLDELIKFIRDQHGSANLDELFYSKHLHAASIIVTEALALWLAGRLARRLLGVLRGLKSSLMVFRIQQRYIFLLILGLILEIFSSLTMSDTLPYLAWPILGVVALAGFLGGLGIVLFIGAMQRMAGQGQGALLWTIMGVVISVMFCHITALVGLADAWFDFRKLERLRQQQEEEARDPEE